MAGRDIQIPFGPDKTGGLGPLSLPEIGTDETPEDPFAEPPIDKYATSPVSPASEFASAQSDSDYLEPIPRRTADPLPVRSFGEPTASLPDEQPADEQAPINYASVSAASTQGMPALGDPNPEDAFEDPEIFTERDTFADYHAGGLSDDEVIEQGYDDMQMSFLALRDSVGKSRELKAREKELQEFARQLDDDREELADREDILLNYAAHVDEQDDIINQHTQNREAYKAELASVSANIQETHEALERMRDYHISQMDPLEAELGRARANADQAKNDERSRKSELNAAESELKRAGAHDDTTMASARLEQVRRAYEDARARSEQAKDALAEVQRIYDEARAEIDSREGPLERSISDYKAREEELKEFITKLGDEISIARKRRQYCDAVFQYPHETQKLREAVEADERTLREMELENDELRDELAQSKQLARKAKLAIGIIAVIIVVVIVMLIILFTRG